MSNLNYILIVEDELVIAENTKYMLQELYPDSEVRVGGSSAEALEILEGFLPDLVLLDIRLGKNDNGIVFAKQLTAKGIPFMFITAHGDERTISNAIETKPVGYLIKPISRQELNVNLKLALSKIEVNHFYIFRDGTHDVRLAEKDIVYLQVEGNYTEIHTVNKRYVVRKSMRKVLDALHIDLIQIHRSYYVNPSFVVEANALVYLSTGGELPLSRNYKKDLLDQLF